jgi:hypothetical protein
MPNRKATGKYKETKFYRVGQGVGVAHITAWIPRITQPWEKEGEIAETLLAPLDSGPLVETIPECQA